MTKYLYLNLRRSGLAIVASFLMGLSQHSFATIITYDFTAAPLGNKGTSYAPDADLTVTAYGNIDQSMDSNPFLYTAPTPTVGCTRSPDCVNTILTSLNSDQDGDGLGVQDPGAGGSSGISGKGGQKNEQAIFTFASNLLASSIIIQLTGIDFSEDEPILYVDLGDINMTVLNFDKTAIQGACSAPVNFACDLDFSQLAGLNGLTTSRFALRETNKEFAVGSLSATVVPVPAAVWLFGSGLLGLIGMGRRKKAA